jgi:multiple sugar transport system permease protein
MSMIRKKFLNDLIFYLITAGFVLFCLFPFIWQILTALKPPEQLFKMPPDWFPSRLYLNNFIDVMQTQSFFVYIRNSFIVASLSTIVCLLFGSLAAYALSRLRIKGKSIFLLKVLAVAIFPQVSIVSPLFLFFRDLNWLNTYQSLIVPYVTFNLPLTIWILTSFFNEIPKELDEAAKIDGCSSLQVMRKVIFPIALPGMFTASILIFIASWNEFLFSLIFTYDENARTVPVGIALFPGLHSVPWDTIAAASVIVTLPLIIIVLLFQKRVISGLTSGSVKG